ncbi:hypothetical protein BgAZ_301240 [Babesia gibsoni]|uniref:Uncharacterized protein n=1 Tax=Babesia gibsoni TaxID=33632 RepID=A0AAD8PDT4_BABGI|nr:hypothetical protein BgAZ_301240 [Babesia gibsoni]
MEVIGFVSALLLMIHNTACYTPSNYGHANFTDVLSTNQPLQHGVPPAGVAGHTDSHMPPVMPQHVPSTSSANYGAAQQQNSSVPFPLSLFYGSGGTPAADTQAVTDVIKVPMVQVSSVRGSNFPGNATGEGQDSTKTANDDKDVVVMHFMSVGVVLPSRSHVKGAKLVLKKTGTGEDFGMTCPTKKVKVSLANPYSGGNGKLPQTIGNGVYADATSELVEFDMTGLFVSAGTSINPVDFKLILEADKNCYFTFSGDPNDITATVAVVKDGYTPELNAQKKGITEGLMTPAIVIALVGISGLFYMSRSKQTDYTYFQNQGEFVPGP